MHNKRHSYYFLFFHCLAALLLFIGLDFIYHLSNYEEAMALSWLTLVGQLLLNISTMVVWFALPSAIGLSICYWALLKLLYHFGKGKQAESLVSMLLLLGYTYIVVVYFNYWLGTVFTSYLHIPAAVSKGISTIVFIGVSIYNIRFSDIAAGSLYKLFHKIRYWPPAVAILFVLIFIAPLLYHAMPAGNSTTAPPVPRAKPNVILFTFDGMRARNMSLYGYPKDTTPFLKSLASQSIVFEHAISPSIKTLISLPSIYYSTYLGAYIPAALFNDIRKDNLPLVSFPELLSKNGYHNYSYVSTALASPKLFGLGKYFTEIRTFGSKVVRKNRMPFYTTFNQSWFAGKLNRYSDLYAGNFPYKTFEWIFSILSNRLVHPLFFWHPLTAQRIDLYVLRQVSTYSDGDFFNQAPSFIAGLKEPYFIHMHCELPHEGCYIPKYYRKFSSVSKHEESLFTETTYNNYIYYADKMYGELVSTLRRYPAFGNTILITSSDHGYLLFKGPDAKIIRTLGWPTVDQMTHVPLLIHAPGFFKKSRLVSRTVSTLDIGPTIAALCGLPSPAPWEGRSLLPKHTTVPDSSGPGKTLQSRTVFSIFINNRSRQSISPSYLAAYNGAWKYGSMQTAGNSLRYLHSRCSGQSELAYLLEDPSLFSDLIFRNRGHNYIPTFDIPRPLPLDSSVYRNMEQTSLRFYLSITSRISPVLER